MKIIHLIFSKNPVVSAFCLGNLFDKDFSEICRKSSELTVEMPVFFGFG